MKTIITILFAKLIRRKNKKWISNPVKWQAKTFNKSGTKNFNYLHTVVKDNLSKLSVITSLETSNDGDEVKAFGKQLSMHIAASNPLALSSELIDKNVINNSTVLVNQYKRIIN